MPPRFFTAGCFIHWKRANGWWDGGNGGANSTTHRGGRSSPRFLGGIQESTYGGGLAGRSGWLLIVARWWFQIFVMCSSFFIPIWGRFPIWLYNMFQLGSPTRWRWSSHLFTWESFQLLQVVTSFGPIAVTFFGAFSTWRIIPLSKVSITPIYKRGSAIWKGCLTTRGLGNLRSPRLQY